MKIMNVTHASGNETSKSEFYCWWTVDMMKRACFG